MEVGAEAQGYVYHFYVVAIGRARCLDEEIAELTGLLTGRKVYSREEGSIIKALRESNLSIEKLVAQASMELLEKAMPELILALKLVAEGSAAHDSSRLD